MHAAQWKAWWSFCTGACWLYRHLQRKEAKERLLGIWIWNSGKFTHLIVEKGSISVNGISLTVFDVKKKSFRVAIIPYTFEHTDFSRVEAKMEVNIEFDIIGKYVYRIMRKSWNDMKKLLQNLGLDNMLLKFLKSKHGTTYPNERYFEMFRPKKSIWLYMKTDTSQFISLQSDPDNY